MSITLNILLSVSGDVYSNSFISPNSAKEPMEFDSEAVDMTSGRSEILAPTSLEPSESSSSTYERPARSVVNQIVSQTTLDDLLTFKNVADSLDTNDVELSGRIAHFIQPSKTTKERDGDHTVSGEAAGAPQARSIPLSEPQEINPTATMTPNFATLSAQLGRQANPDIQDIITGIVKLLHGNANGQTNTAPPAMARPVRPLSTRINNRGPPRITDVPALPPDFDIPAPPLPPPPLGQMPPPVSTTRMPTPYPFDIPPQNTSPVRPFVNGVPVPEQIVPQTGKRPGFYRPVTIPPWNRRRPPPHRRPPPPYKPIPTYAGNSDVSITSEKPNEDILTLDLGSQLESMQANEEVGGSNGTEDTAEDVVDITTEAVDVSTAMEDKEILEFEKNKEKSSSKMDKHTSKPETTSLVSTTIENVTSSSLASAISESVSPTTKLVITSSALSATVESTINETSTPASAVGEAIPVLESSIQEGLHTLKDNLLDSTSLSSTPTESLPEISTASPGKVESTSLSSSGSSTTSSSGNHSL